MFAICSVYLIDPHKQYRERYFKQITEGRSRQSISKLIKMPSKIKALKSREGERNKLRTQYGVWHVIYDGNDICYALCTSDAYPERHAFGLI